MGRIPYFAQTLVGRSRWFDFVFGGWFILIAWMVGQVVFSMPLVQIQHDLGMEMNSAAQIEAMENMDPVIMMKMGFGSLMAMFGVLAGAICYLVSRLTQAGVSKAFGIIAMIGVVLSIVGVALMLPALGVIMENDTSSLEVLGKSPMAYGLILFSFIGAMIGAWLVQRFIHGRTFTSLITAASRIRWSRILWTWALTWGVFAAFAFATSLFTDANIYANPERGRMIPFVIATLLFIPIQCAAEEVMFRGYFNQALGRFIPSAIVVFALTSIAFGAMHLANPEFEGMEGGMFWLTLSSYVMFGVFLSVMVWIDNGLESAIGVHIGNNAFVAIFLNYEGSVLPVPGMFLTESDPVRDIPLGLLSLAVLTAIIWFTRKPLGERNNPLANPAYEAPEAVETQFS